MLGRILGEDVELAIVAPASEARVRVDPTHVEQVILNLVVNARDAMPTGGKLTIETASVDLDEAYVNGHLPAKAGPHVLLAVTDTGVGMDRATQARIFEPFFTTKEIGKGNGLLGLSDGLSASSAQNRGTIWVYSEPRQGNDVQGVPSPRRPTPKSMPPGAPAPPPPCAGARRSCWSKTRTRSGTSSRPFFAGNGYQVIVARNAGEALLLTERPGEKFDPPHGCRDAQDERTGAGQAPRGPSAWNEGALHVRVHR